MKTVIRLGIGLFGLVLAVSYLPGPLARSRQLDLVVTSLVGIIGSVGACLPLCIEESEDGSFDLRVFLPKAAATLFLLVGLFLAFRCGMHLWSTG